MSGLALLAGYGSASDDEIEMDMPAVDLKINDNPTSIIIGSDSKKAILPSAIDLLGSVTSASTKRKAAGENPISCNLPSKISRIVTKKFIPPQIRSVRPNVVTEDTKHR